MKILLIRVGTACSICILLSIYTIVINTTAANAQEFQLAEQRTQAAAESELRAEKIRTLDQVRQLNRQRREELEEKGAIKAIRGQFDSQQIQNVAPKLSSMTGLPAVLQEQYRAENGNDNYFELVLSPEDGRNAALRSVKEAQAKLAAGGDREQGENRLRDALEAYFVADMQYRVTELDAIKARVSETEANLKKRMLAKDESIELQLKLMLREADGVSVFGSAASTPKERSSGWTSRRVNAGAAVQGEPNTARNRMGPVTYGKSSR